MKTRPSQQGVTNTIRKQITVPSIIWFYHSQRLHTSGRPMIVTLSVIVIRCMIRILLVVMLCIIVILGMITFLCMIVIPFHYCDAYTYFAWVWYLYFAWVWCLYFAWLWYLYKTVVFTPPRPIPPSPSLSQEVLQHLATMRVVSEAQAAAIMARYRNKDAVVLAALDVSLNYPSLLLFRHLVISQDTIGTREGKRSIFFWRLQHGPHLSIAMQYYCWGMCPKRNVRSHRTRARYAGTCTAPRSSCH